MIRFGPWHPDASSVNTDTCLEAWDCLPAITGFKPLPDLSPVSTSLGAQALGAAAMVETDGTVFEFAGTGTKLWKLSSTSTWSDVSRLVGGNYHAGGTERWQFTNFGGYMLATNIGDVVQKFDVRGGATNFTALGGSPPQCRYIGVVRDFVVLGGILNNERRVQWSGLGNADFWTPGLQNSDYQDIQSGGPVRGFIGGEVGYIFQAERITRMTFQAGQSVVFQFDEVENGRGLAAPYSLVRLGRLAFYLARDGFYKFDVGAASSTPIGVGEWASWFRDDVKPGTESQVLGGIDPSQKLVLFAYIPRSSSSSLPSRVICYDWALDEATVATIPIYAMAQWLTQGVTLDGLTSYGTLDALPFSLDSPAWRGGAGLLGIFGTDNKLSYLSGNPRAAQWVTADGAKNGRQKIRGTTPYIDTATATVAIAMREKDCDAIVYDTAEAMEDTGEVPASISGNIARARITTTAGASWTQFKGIDTDYGRQGAR